MALTVNSNPANIDNSGAFNVTTSLSEDSTHVNLRVRCDITVSAAVVATVEKPKGIADFDLSEILKAHVSGISFARDSGDLYKVSGGSPLVAYTVLFTEVWEDASGTLTTGDTDNASGTTYRFVPASGDTIAFSNYVMTADTCRFASKTLRNNVTKFFLQSPSEYWLVFFTEVAHVELFYSKDGGAYDHATHFDPTDGWGVIVLNIGELFASVTSNLRIQLGEVGGAKISEVLTIYVDNTSVAERTVLEFDGIVGGKEYLAFDGIKDIGYVSERSYYKASTNNQKLLSAKGKRRQKLETLFKDQSNASYLENLLDSEMVKRLELSYATATDVTVLTESVKTGHSEMFTNSIEIEYAS